MHTEKRIVASNPLYIDPKKQNRLVEAVKLGFIKISDAGHGDHKIVYELTQAGEIQWGRELRK